MLVESKIILFDIIPATAVVAAILLILLWVIIIAVGLVAKRRKQTETLEQHGNTLSDYIAGMTQLERRYAEISRKLRIPSAKHDYYCDLTRLTLKMKSLSPGIFDLDMAQDKLDQILDNCTAMLDAIEANSANNRYAIADKLKRFIVQSIDEIEVIKILSRK